MEIKSKDAPLLLQLEVPRALTHSHTPHPAAFFNGSIKGTINIHPPSATAALNSRYVKKYKQAFSYSGGDGCAQHAPSAPGAATDCMSQKSFNLFLTQL